MKDRKLEKRRKPGAVTSVVGEDFFTPRRVQRIDRILDKRQPDLVMVAEDIHKIHNLSAIIRTCEAMGVYKIHAVKPLTGEFMLNSDITQGCHKWVEVQIHDEIESCLDELKQQGLAVLMADPGLGKPPWELDLTRPLALVFGNELSGLSQSAKEMGDEFIKLPMYGFTKSFNISVAAGMVLYEAMRQRLEAGMLDRSRLPQDEYRTLRTQWLTRKTPGGDPEADTEDE